jgi:hypothetical protein
MGKSARWKNSEQKITSYDPMSRTSDSRSWMHTRFAQYFNHSISGPVRFSRVKLISHYAKK